MQYNEAMTSAQDPQKPAAISVQGLSKRYNLQPVLKDLSLEVTDGSLCVLVGANGAGKTTLLRIIASLVRPDDGTVALHGAPLENNPALRRQIGYLGHQSLFYSDLNAIENLSHFARFYRLDERQQRVTKAIESVDLVKHQHKPVRTYSRGMLQRLGLAHALINDPDLVILDEPTGGMDPLGRIEIRNIIQQLRSAGKTVFFSSHELSEVERVCDQVVILSGGRIVAEGAVEQLARPGESLEQVFLRVVKDARCNAV